MIKLIATDMDGTFLKDDMSFDTQKFDTIYQRLESEKIKFVVASGNQYFQLKSFFEKYPDIIYIAENGAYIRDVKQTYAVHAFDATVVKTILEKLEAIPDLKILVCGAKSAYALDTVDPQHVENMRNYYHHLKVIKSYSEIDDDILKFAITCPVDATDEIVAKLRNVLSGMAEPTSSGHGDIDVIQPGMNKAAGLKELGQILHVNMDEMVAFGDGGNDLEMIREVGLGVAMKNAQSDVIAVSKQMTSSNQDQGVLTFISDLLGD